jgi:hypothetical protein
MIWYSITPKCSSDYALSLDNNELTGGLILAPTDTSVQQQLWGLVTNVMTPAQGWVLVNCQNGNIAYSDGVNGDQIQQAPPQKAGADGTVWNYEYGGDGYGAIQLQSVTTLNLNVDGNTGCATDSLVLAYIYKGGLPNELWNLAPVYK